jgi:hypothetical protein
MSASDEEIGALLRRADALRDQDGISESIHAFWRGYAKSLRDLQSGGGRKAAAKDSAAQHLPNVRNTARTTLPVDGEGLVGSDVQEVLAAQSLQVAGHLVADFEVDGIQQLENGKLAASILNGKHPGAVVDAKDGSVCHESSCVAGTSMAQEPAAVASSKGDGAA